MKRSEMIESLMKLRDVEHGWADDRTWTENILGCMEEKGMLAPAANPGSIVIIGTRRGKVAAYEILQDYKNVWGAEENEILEIKEWNEDENL